MNWNNYFNSYSEQKNVLLILQKLTKVILNNKDNWLIIQLNKNNNKLKMVVKYVINMIYLINIDEAELYFTRMLEVMEKA